MDKIIEKTICMLPRKNCAIKPQAAPIVYSINVILKQQIFI